MTHELLLFLAGLAGLILGVGTTWLLMLPRAATAALEARTEAVTELAVAREALRLHADERSRLLVRLELLEREAEQSRATIDATNSEGAQLRERVSRLDSVETRLLDFERQLAEAARQLADAREAAGRSQAELGAERAAHQATTGRGATEAQARALAESEVSRLCAELAQLVTQQAADRLQFTEKLTFIEEAKRSLTDQFKNLANDILEEKGKRFAEQNQASLGSLLDPLKLRLAEFQTKVDTVYVSESKDRTALAEQVKQLIGLNQALSDDAKNLTSALKGSNKTQGNYGELVLERLLETSGLRRGHEYRLQESHDRDVAEGLGQRAQPDIILSLPEDKSLVIDSKMTLTAYEAYANAENEDSRQSALKAHLASVRSHIRGLSAKNYQELHQLKSLDFVLMFVPLEPAFMAAVTNDGDLFMEAWNKNVLLVSPSTLLFVVRTVAHLWRQEAQTRNAQDIARRGGELYDKLAAFTHDLAKVGERLSQAQDSYEKATNKLSTGKGSVVRKAEMLRELGIKPTKSLAPELLQLSREVDDSELDETELGKLDLGEDGGATLQGSTAAHGTTAPGMPAERARPGRRIDPFSKLSRAREIYLSHIQTHRPRDIKRLMVETLDVSPAVANTYFSQLRNAMPASFENGALEDA